MDYEKDLLIDEHGLDTEWIKQPSLFMAYSKEQANADHKRKKLREKFEVVKADIDRGIRENAKAANEKITEKVVESRIILSKAYQEVMTELSEAEFQYNILLGAVRAFDQKKSALENLVKLFIGGYYSTPKQKDNEDTDPIAEGNSKVQREHLNKDKEEQ